MSFTKILAGFFLAIQVLIFAMLPYFYSRTFSNKKLITAFNNFTAGLFLGIAFLHIIPQSNQSISHWVSLNYSTTVHKEQQLLTDSDHHRHELPYGSLISVVTFLGVLGLEVYMNDGIQPSEKSSTEKRNNSHMHQVLTNQKMKMRRRQTLETYLTQLALSIHSLFECMSIGIQKNEKVLLALAGAIALHKWAQALTLGFSYSIIGMPKQSAFKFALFHAFLNFSAVLIGYQLSETSDLLKGITNGISGGTFLYISMIQKIGKNFSDRQELFGKLGLIFAGLCFSILILH